MLISLFCSIILLEFVRKGRITMASTRDWIAETIAESPEEIARESGKSSARRTTISESFQHPMAMVWVARGNDGILLGCCIEILGFSSLGRGLQPRQSRCVLAS